jgi:hypothetical protein
LTPFNGDCIAPFRYPLPRHLERIGLGLAVLDKVGDYFGVAFIPTAP